MISRSPEILSAGRQLLNPYRRKCCVPGYHRIRPTPLPFCSQTFLQASASFRRPIPDPLHRVIEICRLERIQTLDFFMPVVVDPIDFGRIAAANALSDVYAMGRRPTLALAIVGMPVSQVLAALTERGALASAVAGRFGGSASPPVTVRAYR